MSEDETEGSREAGAAPGGAALTRLTLTDFRNYPHLMLRVATAPVVLTGDNGAGKTNLLEAISLFAPGRGLRRAVLAECARESGDGGFAVSAEFTGPAGVHRLGTGVTPEDAANGRQRQCRIDGIPVGSSGAFAEHVRIIWLVPAMDRLFAGPAGDRRRFLDRLVGLVDPEHGRRLAAYERAMSERNRLLAGPRPPSPAWLDALEAQMAAHGVAIAAARRDALDRLAVAIGEGAAEGPFPPARLALAGSLEEALGSAPATDIEDALRDRLRDARPRDAAAGRALEGPHRSDLDAFHGVTGAPAGRCSTGEQKALLVSIVLAEARLAAAGRAPPILLLDEIAAHLDATRREALFDALLALGGQAWMTGTDPALFAPLRGRASFLRVASGTVRPE